MTTTTITVGRELERPGAYRQSLIAAFDSCPRRALYSILDDRRTPGSLAAVGTLVHRTLHRAVQMMMENGEPNISPEVIMELYADVLSQRDVPEEEVVPLTMRDMQRGRIALVKFALGMTLSVERVVAPEHRIYADLPLPTGETVQISGQIDLLLADPPDGALIIDFKTGYARPKSPRDPSDASGKGLTELGWVQARVYAYLVFSEYPSIQSVTFREYHLMWGENREVRVDRWEMERFVDPLAAQVALLHQAVRAGRESPRWAPSAGGHCALCANPRDCPIKDQVGIPADDQEARRLAQEWIVAGQVRADRTPFLKGWVDARGAIEVPHSKGRRFVGWDISPDGKRSFGLFEPREGDPIYARDDEQG